MSRSFKPFRIPVYSWHTLKNLLGQYDRLLPWEIVLMLIITTYFHNNFMRTISLGLRYTYELWRARIQKMSFLAFKLDPWNFFENSVILSKIIGQKSHFCYLEKVVLKLLRAVMIKPQQIERSVFILLDNNGKLKYTDWSWVHLIFFAENYINLIF